MHSVFIDGDYVETHGDAEVSIVFPEDYDYDEDDKPDPDTPEAWCNSAGIEVEHDTVRVWVSTGDPRGAFVMALTRHPNGEIRILVPHSDDSLPHEETVDRYPGCLAIKRTVAE